MCPFLVPVIADRLWLYPIGAYCHCPDHSVRVPAVSTLARVCSTASYRACPRYRESAVPAPGCAAAPTPRPASSP